MGQEGLDSYCGVTPKGKSGILFKSRLTSWKHDLWCEGITQTKEEHEFKISIKDPDSDGGIPI